MDQKIRILNRWNKSVIFEGDYTSVKVAVIAAINCGVNLARANLSGANLAGANLSAANLSGVNLARANLSDVNLSGAYLAGVNLSGANLAGANLSAVNLSGANLSGAYLSAANLSGAYLARASLSAANLSGAYLARADLSGVDLSGVNLSGANLSGAKNYELPIAMTRILPAGDLIVWKKCNRGILVKLLVPERAKRSHAFGRKCRANFVKVLDVIGAKEGITNSHGPETKYRKGRIVKCDKWDPDFTRECSGGIHFFITKEEAEA